MKVEWEDYLSCFVIFQLIMIFYFLSLLKGGSQGVSIKREHSKHTVQATLSAP